jgi:hypothetical protein
LYRAYIVSPLLTMLTSHLIGSIKSAEFTTGIRTAILSPIELAVLAAIFLPHVTHLRHTQIISTASATVYT